MIIVLHMCYSCMCMSEIDCSIFFLTPFFFHFSSHSNIYIFSQVINSLYHELHVLDLGYPAYPIIASSLKKMLTSYFSSFVFSSCGRS